MSKGFSIRQATIDDAAFLTHCARCAYEGYIASIGKEPAPMVFNFRERLAKDYIEIIQQNDEPAGYIVWHWEPDSLYLDSIALLPERQGQRLAAQALQHLESQARLAGKDMIELYTNEKMTANLTLYPYLGFIETDRRKEDGFNRVFFRKSL